jgi:phosphoglycolate phosphatase
MTKLVIFDLDGTLLNTIDDLAHSANYALQLHHYPTHPVEAYRFFVGNGMNKLIERALPETDRLEETIQRVKSDFMEYYSAHSTEHTHPYPGITLLLEQLMQRNITLAVASNKVHSATEHLIQRFFPHIDFRIVLGQREDFPTKPDPAIVDEILSKTSIAREETLYVGDSGVDMTTAQNAGVRAVAVLWGFRPKAELEAKGATRFASTTEEVLLFL